MRIGFGHMGTLTIVVEMILEELGHEPVTPHRPTRQTLAWERNTLRNLPVSLLKSCWALTWNAWSAAPTR